VPGAEYESVVFSFGRQGEGSEHGRYFIPFASHPMRSEVGVFFFFSLPPPNGVGPPGERLLRPFTPFCGKHCFKGIHTVDAGGSSTARAQVLAGRGREPSPQTPQPKAKATITKSAAADKELLQHTTPKATEPPASLDAPVTVVTDKAAFATVVKAADNAAASPKSVAIDVKAEK
jgi:hypothetical protein